VTAAIVRAVRTRRAAARSVHWMLTLHLVMLALASVYVLAFVQPELDRHAQTGIGDGGGRFLFDSIGYYESSGAFTPASIVGALNEQRFVPSIASLTNLGVLVEGGIARTIFPPSPSLAILFANYGLLVLMIWSYRRVAKALAISWTPLMEVLIVGNPWVWLNMVSLTKEIWGLAAVAAFAFACAGRRWITLGVLGLASAFVRQVYALLALGMGVMSFKRISPWAFLLGVAGLLGGLETAFGDVTGFRISKTLELGQQMAPILELMGRIQSLPFGHVLAFPVVLTINIASPALNPKSYQAPPDAFYIQAATVSSYVFIVLTAILARRLLLRRERVNLPELPGRLLWAFAVLVTLYPISQHRYLLPALPLLILSALGRGSDEPSAAKERPRPTPTQMVT
jgi:hypothetical protein